MSKGGVEVDVKLRPHHLLCIQGFRGQGYSAKFVANLARLIDRLQKDPGLQVRIIAEADDVCRACPHLKARACACPDQDVGALDRKVLKQLQLSIGDKRSWSSFMEVIRKKIEPGEIRGLCSGCRWKDLDFCHSGLQAIQAPATRKTPSPLLFPK